jgi:hypothetical protein
VNSRNKGKVGEREFAALLREHGFDARRGQQFCGSPDSPDVVSDALAWLHVEVKRVQNLNLTDACAQAERDCGPVAPAGHKKPWVVAHRRNHAPWLITMRAEFFFRLLRGDIPNCDSVAPAPSALTGLSPAANSLGRFPSDPNLRGTLPPESHQQKTELNKTHEDQE